MTALRVRVTPRASSDAVTGLDGDGVLHIRVTAPPAGGAANRAVTKLLAKALSIPQRDITLTRGATARAKTFEIALDEDELTARLPHRP